MQSIITDDNWIDALCVVVVAILFAPQTVQFDMRQSNNLNLLSTQLVLNISIDDTHTEKYRKFIKQTHAVDDR